MNTKNEISARFIEVYNELLQSGFISDKKDFANKIGVSASMITEISKGRSSVGITAIQNIVSCFDISAEWIITGIGSMFKESSCIKKEVPASVIQPIHVPKVTEKIIPQQSITLYDIEAAANLKTIFDNKQQNILGQISFPDIPRCDGAVYVRGDSMYPILKSGDIIAYKEIQNLQNIIFGEMYLVSFAIEDDYYVAVKYLQKSELGKDFVQLVSYNTHHSPKDIALSSINALALIKFSIRRNTII